MEKLTAKQERVLKIIAEKIGKDGLAPTFQELANELGVASKNAVSKHLAQLRHKGYIAMKTNRPRTIQLLEPKDLLDGAEEIRLPLLGTITAGAPMLAEENIERYVPVPRSLLRSPTRHFLLRVQGESMKNAGILDGDLVLVRSTRAVRPGDVVVALLDDEATVKRLAARGGKRYLRPENPEFPEIFPDREWSVQGKVVALIRERVM